MSDNMIKVEDAMHYFNDEALNETLSAIQNYAGLNEFNSAVNRSWGAYAKALHSNKSIEDSLQAARDSLGYRLVVKRED